MITGTTPPEAQDDTICPNTEMRRGACACKACARGASLNDKHGANKRDVLALIDFIAGCLECHPSQQFDRADWADVARIGRVREQLMEIAVGFVLDSAVDERAAKRRIEEALSTGDEDVADALIDAV